MGTRSLFQESQMMRESVQEAPGPNEEIKELVGETWSLFPGCLSAEGRFDGIRPAKAGRSHEGPGWNNTSDGSGAAM